MTTQAAAPIMFGEAVLQNLFETYFLHLHKIWNPSVRVCATEWGTNTVKMVARISVEDGAMEAGTKVKWLGLKSGSFFTSGDDPTAKPTVNGVVVLNEMLIGEVMTFDGHEGNHNVELISKLGQMVQVDWFAPNGEVICTAWHTPDQLEVL